MKRNVHHWMLLPYGLYAVHGHVLSLFQSFFLLAKEQKITYRKITKAPNLLQIMNDFAEICFPLI